ncbi:family 20 glycosylhydrolase [Mangrovibacterium marinum]|uniref:beta-N-acetylhexosaminidase n=1 Tax=Mangrovibacterium marinum TaxID=1639118 RepID=A0A2T5BZZ7_9BACT|nr:family 20 glycosylhydrolase [Mangrovibacterium marinum]PTN07823.1 hexosaminidase [Mangrovibacterium marinum]
MNKYPILLALVMLLFAACQPASNLKEVQIIPKPVSLNQTGKSLLINQGVRVTSPDAELVSSVSYLQAQMLALPQAKWLSDNPAGVQIFIALDAGIEQSEGYKLVLGEQILLKGKTANGIIHGIQTLLQILQQAEESEQGLVVPQLSITDYPRFAYRGMHLDVSRHFFDAEFVKKYIDLIAMHKMNTFHWHLTDDQGWRIEIKKYPKLTEVGAWRVDHEDLPWNGRPAQKPGETASYGGFYTQEQIKDIVAYAAERGVNIIPEIDIPGHSAAAIASYPELSCRNAKIGVASGGQAEISIVCGGKDSVIEFYKNVLTEVMDLFPSKYIHIGGDEAWKEEWEKCPLCQKRIKQKKLKDEHGLQSYFIQQLDDFLVSHGRAMIGWDEILEGGLAENATVMSWRGESGGIKSAQMGHDVIMTPGDYCYFDYYQNPDKYLEPLAFNGLVTLSKVYNYEPVPAGLTADEARYVLGAQGNMWTEWMPSNEIAEYRALPRMTALSEVLWSPKELRDEPDFISRLEPFLDWLSERAYNFHIPTPQGIFSQMIFMDEAKVELVNPWPFAALHYTLDGSEPTLDSPVYKQPLKVSETTTLKAAIFIKTGRRGPVKTALFEKADPIDATDVAVEKLQPGLNYAYYKKSLSSVGGMAELKPDSTGVVNQIQLPGFVQEPKFALTLSGYFYAPQTAVYTFALTSDDGSQLSVGDRLVVDHDGYHGPTVKYGQVALKQGYHPLKLAYFDAGGGYSLKLQFKQGDDGQLSEISEDNLKH